MLSGLSVAISWGRGRGAAVLFALESRSMGLSFEEADRPWKFKQWAIVVTLETHMKWEEQAHRRAVGFGSGGVSCTKRLCPNFKQH